MNDDSCRTEHLERETSAGAGSLQLAGPSHPLGATVVAGAVNFSIYSQHASGIDLLFFDPRGRWLSRARVIHVDPGRRSDVSLLARVRTGRAAGARFYWLVSRWTIRSGKRLPDDASKLLLDPYGRAVVVPKHYSRGGRQPGQATIPRSAMKSVVIATRGLMTGRATPR